MKCTRELLGRKQARVFLVLVPFLFLLLVSCGKPKDYSGDYTATYDMKEQLNEDLEASGLPIRIEGSLEAQYLLTLSEDGTFTLHLDTEQFGENLKTTLLNEQDNIVGALLAAEGVTEDMYEVLVQAGGYDSFEEFQNEIMTEAVEILEDEALEDLKEQSSREGNYYIERKTITLKNTSEEQLAEGTIESDQSIHIVAPDFAGTGELIFEKK